jgi:hypothetical protein
MTAMLILNADSEKTDLMTFLNYRNITPFTFNTGGSALASFREDPLEVIRRLRLKEQELGLTPAQLLVVGQRSQPSATDLKKYNISGVIRSHRL